jgi:hypothetical protein
MAWNQINRLEQGTNMEVGFDLGLMAKVSTFCVFIPEGKL